MREFENLDFTEDDQIADVLREQFDSLDLAARLDAGDAS